jgi:GPH family glycoside/pentoside/hexuronide:cation symporter
VTLAVAIRCICQPPSPIIFAGLVGFGFAGVITTMDLVGAKIMDEDTQKHNLRREGIISNALGFMNRLNGLFTAPPHRP